MTSVLPRPKFNLLELPSIRLFRARFCPENVPYYHHQDRYFGPSTAWQLLLRDEYAHRPQDILWINVTAATLKKNAIVIQRERMRRRIRQALWEELRARGYDNFGRRDEGPLKGTLEILIHNVACLDADFGDLRKQTGIVVEAVERQNARMSRREQHQRFEEAKGIQNAKSTQSVTKEPYVSLKKQNAKWKKIKHERQMQHGSGS